MITNFTKYIDYKHFLKENLSNENNTWLLSIKTMDMIKDKYLEKNSLEDIKNSLIAYWEKDDFTNYLFTDSLLCCAAYYGNKQVVDYALSINGNVIDGHLHERPIVYATKNNQIEMVEYLIEKGAHANIQDNDALQTAALKGNLKIIDLLIKNGANVNRIYFPYQTPHVMEHLMDKFENYNFVNQLFSDNHWGKNHEKETEFAIKYLDEKLEEDNSFKSKFKIFQNHEIYWPKWFLEKWEWLYEFDYYTKTL